MTGPPDDQHAVAPGHEAGPSPLQIPLSEVADVAIVEGPSMIKSENGRLVGYVTLNVRGDRDVVGFVEEAQRVVSEKVHLPEGVHLEWSGEFENQVRAAQTLRIILPAVFAIIFVILYLTYKDFADACLMMLAVPEALAGGVFLPIPVSQAEGVRLERLRRRTSIWPSGWATSPPLAWPQRQASSCWCTCARRLTSAAGWKASSRWRRLRQAVIEGAVHRRCGQKLLTEGVAIVAALAPMLFATGVGSEVISQMALPVLGGLLIADEVVDIFLPVRFYWVRRARWLKLQEEKAVRAKAKEVAQPTPPAPEATAEEIAQPVSPALEGA